MREFKFGIFDKVNNIMIKSDICIGIDINGLYVIDANNRRKKILWLCNPLI